MFFAAFFLMNKCTPIVKGTIIFSNYERTHKRTYDRTRRTSTDKKAPIQLSFVFVCAFRDQARYSNRETTNPPFRFKERDEHLGDMYDVVQKNYDAVNLDNPDQSSQKKHNILMVAGGSGSGKTRLVEEFAMRLPDRFGSRISYLRASEICQWVEYKSRGGRFWSVTFTWHPSDGVAVER